MDLGIFTDLDFFKIWIWLRRLLLPWKWRWLHRALRVRWIYKFILGGIILAVLWRRKKESCSDDDSKLYLEELVSLYIDQATNGDRINIPLVPYWSQPTVFSLHEKDVQRRD